MYPVYSCKAATWDNMNVKYLRVTVLFLVVTIVIFTVTFMVGYQKYVQAPLEFLRSSIKGISEGQQGKEDCWELNLSNMFSTINDSQSPVIRCKCELNDTKAANLTLNELDNPLPWMNLTTRQHLLRQHPNLPVHFLYNATTEPACTLMPTVLSLEWQNNHWQEVTTGDGDHILLYSAFYDPNNGGDAPCLRVLGMSRTLDPKRVWCQIWYHPQSPPTVVKVKSVVHLDYQKKNTDRQMPYLLTCPLPPASSLSPAAVSLVASPCSEANNLLQVIGNKEREPSAYVGGQDPLDPHRTNKGWVPAVCGPALYYYNKDFSWRLVEWLELLRAMGFGRVFLYNSGVHPNIAKVFQYYQSDGFLQVTDYNYPPPYNNEPSIKRLWTLVERKMMFAQENIYFTDCLLRHMHQYRFIAHLDPDEVPILPQHDNFTHFFNELLNDSTTWYSGYKLQWNIFYDDFKPQGKAALLPEYLWVLRHTYRLAKDLTPTTGEFKAIYDMDTVRGVFSHGVLMCTTGWCSQDDMKRVAASKGYIAHYTRNCIGICKPKDPRKEELWLQKYRDQVAKSVEKVLHHLQLL